MEIDKEHLSTSSLISKVSEFSKFLEHGNNGIQEIMNCLSRKGFSQFGSQSVHLTRLNSDNQLIFDLMSGAIDSKEFGKVQNFDLTSKLPIVDVFRSGKIMWINTLPDWGAEYPILKDYPTGFHCKTFIAIPIFDGDVVHGVLSIFCEPKLFESDSFNHFFSSIAGLLTLYFINSPGIF